MYIVAAFLVVDPIAVADVETLLGAVSPDGLLNEPRKRPWKIAVELSGVDLRGDRFDDFGAAAWPVASGAIGVVGSEPVQDAGPVQEIVHERIDRDHAAADLTPTAPSAWCAEKQLSQRHHQHLVRDAIDFLQGVKQSGSHSGQAVGPGWFVDGIEAPVDPTDEITTSNVANEQVQRIGGLVEPAVAQPMLGQWAVRQMIRLGAGVPAILLYRQS